MKVFLFLTVLTGIALADDEAKSPAVERKEVTVAGKVYSDATLRMANAVEVVIKHSTGSKRIRASVLEPSLAKELGYDPELAAKVLDVVRKKQEIETARVSLMKGAESGTINVISATESGVLGEAWFRDENGRISGSATIFIETSGDRYLSENTYQFTARRVGVFSYTTVLGASKNVARYRTIDSIIEALTAAQ